MKYEHMVKDYHPSGNSSLVMDILNGLGAEGWRVVGTLANRIILEREVEQTEEKKVKARGGK